MGCFEPLVVEAVAGLVQHAEKRVAKIILVVARGHARVAGAEARAERMYRDVEPSSREIKSNQLRRLARKLLLPSRGILPLENLNRRLPPALRDLANQLHQRPAQRRKNL